MSTAQGGWPTSRGGPPPQQERYRSPLMRRLDNTPRLTIELLRAEVPIYQAGRRADQLLASGDVPAEQRDELVRAKAAGEAAKERLVLAAIPFIHHLARREKQRRQAWQSSVSLDDLVHDGIVGLLMGLARFDPQVAVSPTNYLGQWVVVMMRRGAEVLDNDFDVPVEVAERLRRIRALRSRLHSELGRDPTDEEMITAWADPLFTGGRMMGRLTKTAPATTLTSKHLAEEQRLAHRVGHTARLNSGAGEEAGPLVEFAQPVTGEPPADTAEVVIEQGAREGIARILRRTLEELRLPPLQREVIARRFGLPPFPREQSAREIARTLRVHRDKIGRIIEAFRAEMTRPGGIFHRVCAELPPGTLGDLGLEWVLTVLGDYAATTVEQRNQPLPRVLREPVARWGEVGVPVVPPARVGQPVRAEFTCPHHGEAFAGVYVGGIPAQRSCPRCGRASPLVGYDAA